VEDVMPLSVSSRFKSILLCAGLLGSLFGLSQGPAVAQTQTAELDRIQAPPQALPGTEQRVALVIGNSNYQNVPQLSNPDNDAQSMAQFLNSAGFEVIAATDLTQNDMIKVMQDFSNKVAEHGPNTVAMIYYAGHGVQVAGENYLIPVDARVGSPSDLVNNSLRLVDLMATLETTPSRLRIVMLDSCRNNPFPEISDTGRGLAMVDAPMHSIVGYSTSPGAEALDGSGGHSPYTKAFLDLAHQPNLPIEQLFKRVRLEVNHETEGVQTPWESSSLTSDFYFFGDTAVAGTRAPDRSPVVAMASDLPSRSVSQVYDYVLSEGSPDYYQQFIGMFPHDPLSDRIRPLLANLTEAAAWHEAVLANSPLAYKAFYEKHGNGPYGQAALHLQSQPKNVPLMQASHLFKGNTEHLSLSANAKVTHFAAPSVHGPQNGRVMNMPAHDRVAEHNSAHNDHDTNHAEHAERDVRHDEHNVRHEEHNTQHEERNVHHEENNRPREHFEHAQPMRSNRFADAQAHMGGPRFGGPHVGGPHFGGPHFGGGGFFHRR
jgi:caspase domain-containing protein